MSPPNLFCRVLESALKEVREREVPVFTFVLYHDHESRAVSVCVDTEQNSNRVVRSINAFNMKYFMGSVNAGDLKSAGIWQANVGRNLSLGDFALINLARTPLGSVEVNDLFYVAMAQAVVARQRDVAALVPNADRLVFACSGPDDEIAYVWSLPADA